jgi:hypothetical protein
MPMRETAPSTLVMRASPPIDGAVRQPHHPRGDEGVALDEPRDWSEARVGVVRQLETLHRHLGQRGQLQRVGLQALGDDVLHARGDRDGLHPLGLLFAHRLKDARVFFRRQLRGGRRRCGRRCSLQEVESETSVTAPASAPR